MAQQFAFKSTAESKQALRRSARLKTKHYQDVIDSESEIDTSNKIKLQPELSLNEHEYKKAIDKQDTLDEKTQEFFAIVNSLIRDNVKTRMEHDEVYQDAYRNNDLLTMWEALENWCAAGSIKSVQNRIQAKFMKIYQHDTMSYNEYVTTFSSKLKQLETFNITYSDSLTTELFIQGLNNKMFGEARDKLIMNEEYQGSYNVNDTSYPTTWLMASQYFR
jgi:hypothetical protein